MFKNRFNILDNMSSGRFEQNYVSSFFRRTVNRRRPSQNIQDAHHFVLQQSSQGLTLNSMNGASVTPLQTVNCESRTKFDPYGGTLWIHILNMDPPIHPEDGSADPHP